MHLANNADSLFAKTSSKLLLKLERWMNHTFFMVNLCGGGGKLSIDEQRHGAARPPSNAHLTELAPPEQLRANFSVVADREKFLNSCIYQHFQVILISNFFPACYLPCLA